MKETNSDLVYSTLKKGLLVSIGIIGIPILIWIGWFRNSPWSHESADWNQFSGFLGVFVSIANLVLVTVLTYSIHIYNSSREQERMNDEYARSRPVLVFKSEGNYWNVKNIGHGPAINILISFSMTDNEWQRPVLLYSLMTGEDKNLIWFTKAYQIRAVYDDLYDHTLTSTMQNDTMTMSVERNTNGLSSFTSDQYVRLDSATAHFRKFWDPNYS